MGKIKSHTSHALIIILVLLLKNHWRYKPDLYLNTYFRSVAQQGGLEEENTYPYKGSQGNCSKDPRKMIVKVTGRQALHVADEDALKDALYKYGPLSIGKLIK